MTTVAHAEAEAFTSEAALLLTQPRFAGKPGADLYVAPAWNTIFEALDGAAVLPNLAEYAEADRKVSGAGEQALLTMWQTLGISATENADRSFSLQVIDPRR
jgi:hypothetical protein